jgi:hypothetical protein
MISCNLQHPHKVSSAHTITLEVTALTYDSSGGQIPFIALPIVMSSKPVVKYHSEDIYMM